MHDKDLKLKFLQKERTLDQILGIAREKEDAVARSKVTDGESGDSQVRKVRMNQSSRLSMNPVPIGQQKCSTGKFGHEKHFPSSESTAISCQEHVIFAKRKATMQVCVLRNKILKLLMNMKLRLQRLTQTLKVI